jgi:hypothetical protein
MLLTSEIEVEFIEDGHRYSRRGVPYISQSAFVKIFEPSFSPMAVHMSAKAAGITSQEMQDQWDKKRDDAGEHGNIIHKVLEDSWYGRPFDPMYNFMVDQVRTIVQPSKLVFPEKRVYLDDIRLAGTIDLPSERFKSKGRQCVDVFDYKTNQSKGVTLHTSKLKDDKWINYSDSWFLGPLSHLEHSLYNKYAIQISMYMYMLEMNYNIIPGRLGIIYINSELNARLIPVNYLRYEIKEMIDYYLQLKIT